MLEAGNFQTLQRPFDQLFNVLQLRTLIVADERNRLALHAGTTGTADAVHVIFRHVGQFVVDDVRQRIDVDATGSNIGSHQRRQFALLEFRQHTRACALRFVAMDGSRLDAGLVQGPGQRIGAVLGAGKHQHLMQAARLEQMLEQILFLLAVALDHLLHHRFSGSIARGHIDRNRLMQQARGQFADFRRKSGGKKQILTVFRQQGDDLADIADEAHVEHAVGLIQHENFNGREIHRLLLHVVKQTPGCRHQNVYPAPQVGNLRIDAHPTEYSQRIDGQIFAVSPHAFLDLNGQFACRRQHQHPWHTGYP